MDPSDRAIAAGDTFSGKRLARLFPSLRSTLASLSLTKYTSARSADYPSPATAVKFRKSVVSHAKPTYRAAGLQKYLLFLPKERERERERERGEGTTPTRREKEEKFLHLRTFGSPCSGCANFSLVGVIACATFNFLLWITFQLAFIDDCR
jgi:hypothetical protein